MIKYCFCCTVVLSAKYYTLHLYMDNLTLKFHPSYVNGSLWSGSVNRHLYHVTMAMVAGNEDKYNLDLVTS